jgi:hypothetical protein
MKKILFFALVLTYFFNTEVSAQPIPDFKNQPMLLKDGQLSKLEKQTAEMKVKAKGMGYGGVSNYINLVPANSPVAMGNRSPEFVIKVEDDVDPETVFYLTLCKTTGKNRQVEMMRMSAFAAYGAGGKSTKKDHVSLTYTKIADNVFKITVDEPLESGEYAFVNSSQGTTGGAMTVVYCFAIK